VGGYLTERYQGAGAIVYAGLLGLAFQNPLQRWAARPGFRTWRERVNARWAPIGGRARVVLLFALVLAALFLVPWELTVSGEFARSGALFEGELVARRALEESLERPAVSDKELAAAQAEVAAVSAGDLALTGDLAGFRKELAVAQKEVEEARAQLQLLEAGSRPEEIEGAEATLARLLSQRSHLEEQLRLVTVRSAVGGVVTTPKPRERVGQYMKKGDLIVEVHEFTTVRVEIAVPEREIGDVKVGQPVIVKARAFPERPSEGRVTAIAPVAVKDE